MNKPDEDSHTKLQDDHETIDLYNFGKPGNIDTAHIPPRTTSLTSFATLEAEELQFTRWYRVRHILSKALFSRVYFVLYFIIIAISLFLLIWNLVNFWDHPKEIWYMILEGFINFSLVVDVIARMIVEGTTYFKKWFNYLDMFLTALCVVLFVIYVISVQGSVQEAVGQNLDVIIILLRLAAQIPRVILFIRNQSKRHKIAKEQAKGIDLTSSNVDLDFTLGETYISERDSVTSNEEEDRKNYV